ncbi:hypothetical protein F6B41_07935 [Microbacterium lushaniae]|nr:hypothetical protein F6B41_28605 [Microbacterium lushaniae]KAA9156499.1 hypothetical protein F6B41_07935 [Microbacterium lushaniae]
MRGPHRHSASWAGVVLGMAVIVAGITGCAAPAGLDATPDPSVTTTTPPTTVAAEDTIADQESCEAFSDVSTILQNATVGKLEKRMTQQEYDGWMRLATRVLDRVPTRGEGAVSDAITKLKEVAPAIPVGTGGAANIGTPEWIAAAPLADACIAAGYPLHVEGFTGG